jgi:chaperonin GroEL
MPRQLRFDQEALSSILAGMIAVERAVGSTLGPRGRTVAIGRPFGPALLTKDGVTVADSIILPDPWENEGAKLIREVARRTATEAGDGTTAATILTHAIFAAGVRIVAAGAAPQPIERGIKAAAAQVTAILKSMATPIEGLEQLISVATIAANGEEALGTAIGQAIHRVGLEGVVTLDRAPGIETVVEYIEGLEFKRGFLRPDLFMANPERGESVFDNCNIFVTDQHLIDGPKMGAFLETYIRFAKSIPLLIIAENAEGHALQYLAGNNGKTLRVAVVRAPAGASKREELEDIAVFTGATGYYTSMGKDFSKFDPKDLGSASRVVITHGRTTIIGGHGNALEISTRKDGIRARIAEPGLADIEKVHFESRLARLASGVAVIKIGAHLDVKVKEARDRVEDSIYATRAALQEGIVPGGGTALIHCAYALLEWMESCTLDPEELVGSHIVHSCLSAPLHRIASNAGMKGDLVVGRVESYAAIQKETGYNAATNNYEDIVAAGIIDPVKVVRLALSNSAELAGLLLTTACLVIDIPAPAASQGAPTLRS